MQLEANIFRIQYNTRLKQLNIDKDLVKYIKREQVRWIWIRESAHAVKKLSKLCTVYDACAKPLLDDCT